MKKKGSALIFVILILAVLFTLSVGLMEISLASLRQSSNYYNKNIAFYYLDSSMEKIFFYIDKIADEAREEANRYCFNESGYPNLSDSDISREYKRYLQGDISKEDFDSFMKEKFLEEFNKKICKFFNEEIEIKGEVVKKDDLGNEYEINLNSWKWKSFDSPEKNENSWFNFILKELNKYQNVNIYFELFPDAINNPEFKKLFKEPIDRTKFEIMAEDHKGYLKQTILLKVELLDENIKRYMVSTFEFNPFGKEKDQFNLSRKRIIKGYNPILDYPLISGRNLLIANGDKKFIIDGDIYVRGSGNRLEDKKSYNEFGGILVGIDDATEDDLLKANINPPEKHGIQPTNGNLEVNGNVYAGGLTPINGATRDIDKYKLNSGFVRIINNGSNLKVNGNIYCHSIVTDESAEKGKIETTNAYIADNVSIYAPESEIKINDSLISFETADDSTNYNSSSSIVINDDTAKLNIRNRVVLFGSAFVDGLINKNNGQLYKTLETVSINPNFMIYNYNIGNISTNSGLTKWVTTSGDYEDYIIQNGDEYQIKMFNTKKSINNLSAFDRTIGFILHYILGNKYYKDEFDQEYILGSDEKVKVDNLKIENSDETSYFPYIFINNGRLFSVENLYKKFEGIGEDSPQEMKDYKDDLDIIKKEIADKFIVFENGQKVPDPNFIRLNLIEKLVEPTKRLIINKIHFKDKGLNGEGFEDYVDFENIPDIAIKDEVKKIYIHLSFNDITFDGNLYDGYNILLVSKKNIYIKNSSPNKVTLNGNIISGEDIIVYGNDIELKSNPDISMSLMNYFSIKNDEDYQKCLKLYKFFSKGTLAQKTLTQDIYSGFNETAKSNISVISKRQIIP